MSSIFVAGLDLGQTTDYTALVIVEARGTLQKLTTDEPIPRLIFTETMPLAQLDVRYVERFPLNTPYQDIANQMTARCARMPAPRYLAVDKTGVGAGPCEMLYNLSPLKITIHGGDEMTRPTDVDWRVPKRDLVSACQIVSQNHVMRIAKDLPYGNLLTSEMLNFRQKISARGHDTYEAWRENEHDDLVLALAIATWTSQMIISINAANIVNGATRRYEDGTISPY